jgi:Peptidase family S41
MTRHFCVFFILTAAILLFQQNLLRADETNAAPNFQEVYHLLRTHLPGATDESLNRAAVDGLLAQFQGKVWLAGMAESETNAVLAKSEILEGNVAYFRVNQVAKNLPDALSAANRTLTATNKIAGAVLDLRFADGDDLSAAQASAKFIKSSFSPLAILINGETSGAAETLAAALRKADGGLLIGSATAGGPGNFKEFTLSDGERLRIETQANGAGSSGLQPDIAVNVSEADERAFMKNPYGTVAQNETNSNSSETSSLLPFIDHMSEADLVREKIKDGGDENAMTPPPVTPQKPVIRDPVLARAVDLIKGLEITRHPSRS